MRFLKPLPIGVTNIGLRSPSDPSDFLRWTPEGLVRLGVDIPGEPLRTSSVYGVRGSKKYPFGKAFPDQFELDGWEPSSMAILSLLAMAAYFYFK